MYLEQAIGLMSLVLASLSGLGTVYIALQLSSLRRIYAREAHASQMQRTLEVMQLSPQVERTIAYVLNSNDEHERQWMFDGEITIEIFAALASLEILATGILADVYDEELTYASLGYSIPAFYRIVEPLVYESRSRSMSVSLYIQLEHLARRWSDRDRYSNRSKVGAR